LVPAGHTQLSTSVRVTPPTGISGETLDSVRALEGVGRRPTPVQLEQIATAATAAVVQPPSADGELALAYGLSERFELDARVGSTSAGLGLRVQLLRVRPGIYAAVGAMASLSFNEFPVERFTDRARVESFRRQDFAFPLTLGYSRRRIHLWGGPKVVLSRFRSNIAACMNRRDSGCRSEAELRASGFATYVAGQFGLAVGSNRFWVAAELTVARARIRADLDVEMGGSSMQGNFDRRGMVLTPAIGLILWL
jgi:hypothetical protein